jgi:hypothetical protein
MAPGEVLNDSVQQIPHVIVGKRRNPIDQNPDAGAVCWNVRPRDNA